MCLKIIVVIQSLQIVIWDISAYEEQFMSNKGPSLGDNKGPAANLVKEVLLL